MVSISSPYKIYPLHNQIFLITQRVTEGRREEKKKKMLQTNFIFHQTACNLKFLTTNSQVEQIHSRFQGLTELKLANWVVKVIFSSTSLPPSVPPFPPPSPPFSILPWLFLPSQAEGKNCNSNVH